MKTSITFSLDVQTASLLAKAPNRSALVDKLVRDYFQEVDEEIAKLSEQRTEIAEETEAELKRVLG